MGYFCVAIILWRLKGCKAIPLSCTWPNTGWLCTQLIYCDDNSFKPLLTLLVLPCQQPYKMASKLLLSNETLSPTKKKNFSLIKEKQPYFQIDKCAFLNISKWGSKVMKFLLNIKDRHVNFKFKYQSIIHQHLCYKDFIWQQLNVCTTFSNYS